MNKYQEALDKLLDGYTYGMAGRHYYDILQELVDKENPMKVDKKDTIECECDDDWEYFPYTTTHYRCPNRKCKLHHRYELNFETERCPICNQLLDWSDTDE